MDAIDMQEYSNICNKMWFFLTARGCCTSLYKNQKTLDKCIGILEKEDFVICTMDCSNWDTYVSFNDAYNNFFGLKLFDTQGNSIPFIPKKKGVVLVLKHFGSFFDKYIEESKDVIDFIIEFSWMYNLFDRKLVALLNCDNSEFNNILFDNSEKLKKHIRFRPLPWLDEIIDEWSF